MNPKIENIRQPFGSFDGRFPSAVILNVQSDEQWEVLGGLRELKTEEIEKIANSHEPRLFNLVSLVTTFDHERRHFHDFMLSPVGSAILTARLSIVMDSIQALSNLTDSTHNFNALPLPLTRWIKMSAEQQGDYLSSINKFISQSGSECQLVGPRLTPGQPVFEALASAGRSMERVTSVLASQCELIDNFSIGLVDVAEASALIVQAQVIWTVFGETAAEVFLDGVRTGPDTIYSQMANLFIGLNMSFTILGSLTTWALLGDIHEAPPELRFAGALFDLVKNGCPENAGPLELFNRWDERFGTKSIAEVMRQSLDNDLALLDQRRQVATISGKPLAAEIADYYKSYSEARRDLVEWFLADPAKYTNPYRYWESAGTLRQPHLVVSGSFETTRAKMESDGITVVRSEYVDGTERPTVVIIPPPEHTAVHDIQTARDMMFNFIVADATASEVPNEGLDAIKDLKDYFKNRYHVLRLPL